MGARTTRLIFSLVMLVSFASAYCDDVPLAGVEATDFDRRLQAFIQQLGAEQYATREKAQAEIERIGLVAFDALHAAQDHEDVEIALRSRYLLRALPISWFRESDPERVKNVLKGYGEQSDSERGSRIEQLAVLEDGRGIAALCRLARFETSHLLAKQAALLVFRAKPVEGEKQTVSETIIATLGSSRRAVADWLKTYARSLLDPTAMLPVWQTIVAAEQSTLAQFPERSSPLIVRDLLRWQTDQLLTLGKSDEAARVVQKMANLSLSDEKEVEETVEWLLERQYFELVEQVAERYVEKYSGSAILLYLLAQTQRELGKADLSEQTSQRAFEKSGDQAESRNPLAERLRDRGLFDWSEREFRQVLKLRELGHPFNIFARFVLSEMLHDIERDRDAAEVLEPLVDEFDRNPMLMEMLQRLSGDRDVASIKSRMHYFYALHALAKNDRAEHLRRLTEAANNDAQDADVLIAMYQLPMPDEAWKENSRRLIRVAAEEFLKEIVRCEMRYSRMSELRDREDEAAQWAKQCNQYAWLVGNTEGDLDRAISLSLKSIELRPKASGYFDTLARCYYSKGDLNAAVKNQTNAVKMEPFSGQMRRQLQLFESSRAKSNPPPP